MIITIDTKKILDSRVFKVVLSAVVAAVVVTACLLFWFAVPTGLSWNSLTGSSFGMWGNKLVSIDGYFGDTGNPNSGLAYLCVQPKNESMFGGKTGKNITVLAVNFKSGVKLTYTNNLIRVTGTIVHGNFKDTFGFTYKEKLVDATYTVVPKAELNATELTYYNLNNTKISKDSSLSVLDTASSIYQYISQAVYFKDIAKSNSSDVSQVTVPSIDVSQCDAVIAQLKKSGALGNEFIKPYTDAENLAVKINAQIKNGSYKSLDDTVINDYKTSLQKSYQAFLKVFQDFSVTSVK